MGRSRSNRLGWLLASALLPGIAGAQVVSIQKMPPLAKGIAAFPEIREPKTVAQRAINTAVARLDRKVLAAAKSCKARDKAYGAWERTVTVTMAGPGWLSYEFEDLVECRSAYPNRLTMSIVYDMSSGKPVDWTKLLPASLTGTGALSSEVDEPKMVTLSSKSLYELYLAGYPAGHSDCLTLVKESGDKWPARMMVWLDAAGDGIAVQFDLAHNVQACAVPVTISTAMLRRLGANAALLDAIDAAHANTVAETH